MISIESLDFRDDAGNGGDRVSTDNAVAPYFSFGLDKASGADAFETVLSVETFL
jgi:hypothetical protein